MRIYFTTLVLLFATLATTAQNKTDSSKYNCFNSVDVRVLLPSDIILQNEKIVAEILLVQTDTNANADVYVEGWKTWKMEKGKATYTTVAFKEGEHSIRGQVNMFVGDKYKQIRFEKKYTIIPPILNISADRMNVLYVGVENPVSIVVPGYEPDKIAVKISSGEIQKVKGTAYIVKVYEKGEAIIRVDALQPNGTYKSIGSAKYRVRNAPMLFSQISSLQNGGSYSVDALQLALKSTIGIKVSTGEGFPFENLSFTVAGYTFALHKAKGESPKPVVVAGEFLTADILEQLKTAESGDKIIIDAVKLTAPDEAWTTMPYVITIK